ncbi:CitMHS family transporter [Rhodococcoides kyotonense]|uniref:Citrate-Mg2+:H+ or citrate-Ca2+:H+ symporter, CitMHS family n=1 Tax=Rhodococcoides kyotonense TaxID=398843 RepID=A0A239FJS2_9NOCA|nr:citrate:proton symporter [Rhodococcus kyotonensis]SNS57065.1 citrate-Mg2+:H+ or citrate-Ca2+:H+ symporter, CitMHS family [Rhodococcus kyotonensis]
MLAALGFATIATFLALTFTRRVSVLVALVLVPIAFALIGGFAPELGGMIADGLIKVAPVAIMIAFAVLYFSLMVDQGLFDPAIRRVVRWAGGSPTKIAMGTAVLTLLVALDGDGTSTFLIMVSAMLPIYQRIGMRPLALTGIVCLGAGVMNMIPWGGPTVRAMAALDATSGDIFTPVVPAMAVGALWVVFSAFLIGRMEGKRLGTVVAPVVKAGPGTPHVDDIPTRARVHPVVMTFNVVLTLVLLVILLFQLAPLQVAFAIAFALAIVVNRPKWDQQQELFAKHGGNVTMVVVMILAAGVLTGILNGTGMITAMAEAFVSWIPDSAGSFLPLITAVTSMPLSLVFTPDAYYFGVVPVLAETTASFGGDPFEIGRAAILGQMTTGFPLSPLTASTFILVGMTNVELGKHQRFIFGWAFGTTIVMTMMALLTGAISL